MVIVLSDTVTVRRESEHKWIAEIRGIDRRTARSRSHNRIGKRDLPDGSLSFSYLQNDVMHVLYPLGFRMMLHKPSFISIVADGNHCTVSCWVKPLRGVEVVGTRIDGDSPIEFAETLLPAAKIAWFRRVFCGMRRKTLDQLVPPEEPIVQPTRSPVSTSRRPHASTALLLGYV